MPRVRVQREPPLEAKRSAFSYQHEAFMAIRDLEYAAVFHEQGLGKTKIAIDLMLYWLSERLLDTILVVTKKSLIHNWVKELELHTFLRPRVLSQSRRSNFHVFNSPARVIIANYELLRSENARLRLFLKSRDVAAVLDESARIKNPKSLLSQDAFALAPLFKKRIIMTGTPIPNRPFDLWAQIFFLDQGKSLGTDYEEFKRTANLENRLSSDLEKREAFERTLDSLFDRIERFAVRETKESVTLALPEKIIKNVVCDWERGQYGLYKRIRDELRAVVVRGGIPSEDDSGQILKRLLRLVQVASNPRLIDESYHADPGKLDHLLDIVSHVTSCGEKCIIWTSFTDNVDWLAKELARFGTRRVHGKIEIARRNSAIHSFETSANVRILIATPGAAKEGLTLTAANHVVFYDRSFSLDDYLQAQDRIHRISQTRKCFVHNLIMRDSVDEWIDILLESKRLAAQFAQKDIPAEQYRRMMTYDFGTLLAQVLQMN